MEPTTRRSARFEAAAAFAGYLLISIAFFGRAVLAHMTTSYIGRDTDPPMFMWFLRWWPYAASHRLNPFFTDLLWAPVGTTLAWATIVPFPTAVAFPIERALGPVAAYNVLMLAAPALAAAAAFLLCRRITDARWPSLLGGFIFGFSPYMLGQTLAHLNLVMIFPIPLAVLAAIDHYEHRTSARRFTVILAAILLVEFLCAVELYATMTLFGAIAFAIALAVTSDRSRLLAIFVPIAGAYAISVAAIAPYLWAMLAHRPPAAIWSASRYSADLLNFVIPTDTNMLGTLGFVRAIAGHFSGDIFEIGACVSIPLLVIFEAWRRQNWATPAGKILALAFASACVAALGPLMMVAGKPILPMPWTLAMHLPLIGNALPVRFAMFAMLAMSIIAASWFASGTASALTKQFAAIAVLTFMMPNPSASFWTAHADNPAFFRDGLWKQYLSAADIVLPLPYGQAGSSMLWQATAGMNFRMAAGWTTLTPLSFDRSPVVNYFLGAIDLPEAGEQLKAFVAKNAVTAIVADRSDPNFAVWQRPLGALDIAPIDTGGVYLYRIPPGKFAPYTSLSGEILEARAVMLRFRTIARAGSEWLSEGRDSHDLSPENLKARELLPATWVIDTRRNAYRDFWIGRVPSGAIGIAIRGTHAALRPLVERVREHAAKIYFPYPIEWNRASNDHDPAPHLILFEFDPHNLKAAADDAAAMQSVNPAAFWPSAAQSESQPDATIPAGVPREVSR